MTKRLKKLLEEESEFERCTICENLTDIKKDTLVDLRYVLYFEGVGQLCGKCYKDIYLTNNLK